jgi:hypothetical protein
MTMDNSASSRVEYAIAGTLPLKDLTDEERAEVNARLDANIQAAVATADFGAALSAADVTTVSLDEHGRMVERRPDGKTSVVGHI